MNDRIDERPLEEGVSLVLAPIRYTCKTTMREVWGFDAKVIGNHPLTAPMASRDTGEWVVDEGMLTAALVADVRYLRAKMAELEEMVLAQKRLIDKMEKSRRAPSAR